MFRTLLISIVLLATMTAANAGEPASVAKTVDRADALYTYLHRQGDLPPTSVPLGPSDFSERPDTPVGQCVSHCDGKFVDGYGLCYAMVSRLSAQSVSGSAKTSIPTPKLSACGRSAVSGYDQCRKQCGVRPLKPVSTAAD